MAKEKDESQAEEKAIQHAWDSVEKDFGKGSVMHGQTIIRDIEAIPTGSLRLDIALGIGGVPRGRITEIYGPEASGKTTLCMEIVKNVQAKKGRAMFVDVENAFDSAYAKRINLDMDKLYLSQPNSGEQALTIVERFVASNAMDLIVIDSVAGLVPQAELEGDLIDKQMGAQAALMSKALRKLAPIVNKTKTCVIFTNQLREKIGVMFGNPETTSGGRALKYWASVRIEIRRLSTVKEGDDAVAIIVRAKVQKNKVAPPFRQAEFKLVFGRGIQREACIADMAEQCGILKRAGAWICFKDEKIGNGIDQALKFLVERPEITAELENLVREEIRKRDVIISKPEEEAPEE
jgi:recombination protein RecA